MRRSWFSFVPLVLLSACVSSATGVADEQFAGHYSQGFEVDAFRPCGSEERWWVTEGTELRSRYAALSPKQYEEVYVEIRGHAGPSGRYGHLGAYTRELAVGEVITMAPAAERNCR
jgi:hypothetical protein